MKLLSVEYDEDSGCILLTLVGTEDDAIECDQLVEMNVLVDLVDE